MASNNGVTLEALFDDFSSIPSKNQFKDVAIERIKQTGKMVEVLDEGDVLSVKVIDPLASQGYNMFASQKEYQSWLGSQLFEPSQEQMEEALDGSRT